MCCKADAAAPHELLFLEKDGEKIQKKGHQDSNISYDLSSKNQQENSFSGFQQRRSGSNLPSNLFDQERQLKLQSAAQTAEILRLRVLSSSTLSKNSVISINPLGYEFSLRGTKDGVTYFGCKKRAKGNKDKAGVVNDFVIPIQDKNLSEQHRGPHFMIYFDTEKDKYIIKDLAVGFGTFVKLDQMLVLKDNHLLHAGQSYIVVNLLPSDDGQPRLRLKLFGGPGAGKVSYFSYSDFANSPIRLGRFPESEVHIQDTLLSKNQATIMWRDGWLLYDGDYENQRPSTNGTWMYLSESYEMYDKMIFKSNHTLFQVTLG